MAQPQKKPSEGELASVLPVVLLHTTPASGVRVQNEMLKEPRRYGCREEFSTHQTLRKRRMGRAISRVTSKKNLSRLDFFQVYIHSNLNYIRIRYTKIVIHSFVFFFAYYSQLESSKAEFSSTAKFFLELKNSTRYLANLVNICINKRDYRIHKREINSTHQYIMFHTQSTPRSEMQLMNLSIR